MATSSSKRPRSRSKRARETGAAGPAPYATTETASRHSADSPAPETLEPLNGAFDPEDAMETLWCELTRVEALAHAASQTLESMPCGQDPAARRAAERIYILVMATAESAEAALNVADAQLARFNEMLAARARGKQP